MKKKAAPKKKQTFGSGLILRKNSFSNTITEHGEPTARFTIPNGDIEGLQYETDWKNHSLVKIHGCTPEGAEAAVKSACVARRKALAAPAYEETQFLCEQYAIGRFWHDDGRCVSQRFRDFAQDIEELEVFGGLKTTFKQFVIKLAQASRKKWEGKSRPKHLETWLLDNWTSGEIACVLNSRQISEKLKKDRIEYSTKKLDEKIRALGLKRAKRPERVKGYSAHSR